MRKTAFTLTLLTITALLFGTPWWILIHLPNWDTTPYWAGTLTLATTALALPLLMWHGHGKHHDPSARIADTLLGLTWILFTTTALAGLTHLILGTLTPTNPRTTATAALALWIALSAIAAHEARKQPRTRLVEVPINQLPTALDGLTITQITDTHYDALDRTAWSEELVRRINTLGSDLVVHTGDLADGPTNARMRQVKTLQKVHAPLGKAYITGNHEYFGDAQAWLDTMENLGWTPLHNSHITIQHNGATLTLAGIDDRTAAASGVPGHGANLTQALAGADADAPVVLLAHQPKQVFDAVSAGVDLQLSGHTHGGQIWPFHYLVLTDQPMVQGLRRFGEGTWLFTSRGTGYWGPPFRLFAPSEITVLTLRRAA